MTLEEAKTSITYIKTAHPEMFREIGGSKINDEIIEEALEMVHAVAGSTGVSDDEMLKRELKRICSDA